jgi:hypothetical protein
VLPPISTALPSHSWQAGRADTHPTTDTSSSAPRWQTLVPADADAEQQKLNAVRGVIARHNMISGEWRH